MGRENQKRFERILESVTSENVARRREGWRELHDSSAEFRQYLDEPQLRYLRELAFAEAEKDEVTFRVALKAIMALLVPVESPALARTDSPSPHPDRSRWLAEWLWDPFHQRSAVLAVTATKYRRRDEGALLWLGRRLSYRDYPYIVFPQISLESPDLDPVLFSQGFQAFGVVGRLSLFGESALERLGGADLRFGFDVPRRPKGLPPGELARDYHCVVERAAGARREYHQTVEEDGFRTDFAVVQRYPVQLGTRQAVAVIIAGASSLGTSAAARWAGYDLFQPTDTLGGTPIMVPPTITAKSRMEALLCVRAKVTTSAWEDPEIKLRRLFVDGASWSPQEQQWHVSPIQVITIVRRRGRPVRILFDGQRTRLEPQRQAFRLTVALAEQARRNNGKLDIAALVANQEIWTEREPDEEYVRSRLRALRHRHLKETLVMRGGLELRAEIDEVDAEEL